MRNYAFIDSQNLNLGVRAAGWQLDFEKFIVYLRDKFDVEKAYLFIGYIKENRNLYQKLMGFGYTLVFKPTFRIRKGAQAVTKGNVDAELVLHTVTNLKNYGKAVIVTGDGDFHCLLEYLRNKKKLRALVVPNKYKYSYLLRNFSGYIEFASTKRMELEYKNGRHNP